MSISILKNIFQCKWAFLNENFSGIVSKILNSWLYQPQRISTVQILFCATICKTKLKWIYVHFFPHSLSSFSIILAGFFSFLYSACFIVLVLFGFVGLIFLLVLFWFLPGLHFANQATFLIPKPLFDPHWSSPVGSVPSASVWFLLSHVVANHSSSPGPGPVLIWKSLHHKKISLSWIKYLRPEEMHIEGREVWSTKTYSIHKNRTWMQHRFEEQMTTVQISSPQWLLSLLSPSYTRRVVTEIHSLQWFINCCFFPEGRS